MKKKDVNAPTASATHAPKTKKAEPSHKTIPLQLLPGSVCVQYRRCGKKNCRCANGQLHGPYHSRFYHMDGKAHQEYIRKADVEEVRAVCDFNREIQQTCRQNREAHKNLMQQFRLLIHQAEEARGGKR